MTTLLEKAPMGKTKHLQLVEGLLANQRQYIDYFFDHINLDSVAALIELLYNSPGIALFSGVGKSGLVAKKIAATLNSTGSRAFYLSPTNALHGDIGIVSEKDVFFLLSKSGESEELLNLIPALRSKAVRLVGIVSDVKSRLARACDFVLQIPVERELCPFNLAPTTSTTAQLLLGDLIAIGLMQLKSINIEQYAVNHPAGRIGKRATLKVRDLMLKGPLLPLCRPHDTLKATLPEISEKRCGCVLVTDDDGRLLGVFTDGDLRRALVARASEALKLPMRDLMTVSFRSIGPNELAWKALQSMESDQKRPITMLAVLDEEKRVLGLVKMHDIIQSGI